MGECAFCEGRGEVPVLPLPDNPADTEFRECVDCYGTGIGPCPPDEFDC